MKSVGLLKQSQVYGPAYRDEDLDDDATISSHKTKVAADHFSKKVAGVKDLISFDEVSIQVTFIERLNTIYYKAYIAIYQKSSIRILIYFVISNRLMMIKRLFLTPRMEGSV